MAKSHIPQETPMEVRLWRRARLGELLIIASCVAVYSNSLHNAYVFDDLISIVGNDSIRSLWPIGRTFDPPIESTSLGRPILNLSLAINHAWDGTDVVGYHVVNIAIHTLAALTLLGIARRTFRWPRVAEPLRSRGEGLSLAIALVWAVHPLQTESVTYVVQRAESLAGLFYLLALYCMMRGAAASERRGASSALVWNFLSVAACFLGVGTKEVVVTAPFLILLYDRAFVSNDWKEVFSKRGGLYSGLFLSWVWLARLVIDAGGRAGTAGFGTSVGVWEYFQAQWWAITHYLRLAFWPDHLLLDYGERPFPPTFGVYVCGAALFALFSMSVVAWWRIPMLSWLGLSFFALLSPSSSVVPVATQFAAEHRFYLALAPVIALTMIFVDAVWRKASPRMADGFMPAVAVSIVVALFGARTWIRNRDYRTTVGMYARLAADIPLNARAHSGWAVASFTEGDMDTALREFTKTIELNPEYPRAHFNRGCVWLDRGELDKAMADYDRALELNPKDEPAMVGRGQALQRKGAYEDALIAFNRCIEVFPDSAVAHAERGATYSAMDRVEDAEREFGLALEIDPNSVPAHVGMARLHGRAGRLDDAIQECTKALSVDPTAIDALVCRGVAHESLGHHDLAVHDLTQAIASDPKNGEAYEYRGAAYAGLGLLNEALADLEMCQSLGRQPDNRALESLRAAKGL